MPNEPLQEDTKQELTEGEKIKLMIESDGWKLVRAKLDEKIIDLQMIGNVSGGSPQEKVTNMEARTMAVEILFDWLKDDIVGRIEQFENNKIMISQKEADDSYLERS